MHNLISWWVMLKCYAVTFAIHHKQAGVYDIRDGRFLSISAGTIPTEETVDGVRKASFVDGEGSRMFHAGDETDGEIGKRNGISDGSDVIPVQHHSQSENESVKRKLVPTDNYLWPKGILVYSFNDSSRGFSKASSRANVLAAMKLWEENTCVRFVERGERARHGLTHHNYLDIGSGRGCASFVGYAEIGGQGMYLSESGCMKVGIIAHELGHAMGLFHEQSRMDRLGYIRIKLNNIKPALIHNFDVRHARLVAPYDLGSIMHYGSQFFANKSGQDTIIVQDPHLHFLIGQRVEPSFYDYMTVNKAYKCNDGCSNSLVCNNEGYEDSSCACRCPEGLTGAACDAVTSACGGVVHLTDTESRHNITSPNYPSVYPHSRCVWLYKAPDQRKIRTILTRYDIARDPVSHTCYHWVEVRYSLLGQDGPSYCGSSSVPLTLESYHNAVLVSFDATNSSAPPLHGFHMEIALIATSGCDGTGYPCQNGATCRSVADQIQCVCPVGFSGDRCETIVGEVTCTFDTGRLCFLVQASNDDFQWTVSSGNTPSKNTGPHHDFGGAGYYIFTEASKPRVYRDVARLLIDNVAGGSWCLALRVHMRGLHMGTLRVYLMTSYGESSGKYKLTGNRYDWMPLTLTLQSIHEFRVVIEGVIGAGWSSDMALDNLSLKPSACPQSTAILFISHTPDNQTFFCDFSEDLCDMSQDTNDDFDWSRHSGNTPTLRTGPEFGQGETGYYLFIETSTPRRPNHTARISTPFIDYSRRQACVSFSVHGYGAGLGSLTATVAYGAGSSQVVWGGAGGVSDDFDWLDVSVTVPVLSGFKVVFEGVRGPNYRGDYALDDVEVVAGPCQLDVLTERLPYLNDVEDSLGAVTSSNAYGQAVEWTREEHTTPQGVTHVAAITFGESGHTGISGVDLVTGVFVFLGRYCLRFDYGIEGEVYNPLTVYLRMVTDGELDEIWTSDLHITWSSVSLSFTAIGDFQFVFATQVWYGYARFTLDNISVTIGPCM